MQQRRLVALMDCWESSGLWQRSGETGQLPLRPATDEELELVILPITLLPVNSSAYLRRRRPAERNDLAMRFGFGEEIRPLPACTRRGAYCWRYDWSR